MRMDASRGKWITWDNEKGLQLAQAHSFRQPLITSLNRVSEGVVINRRLNPPVEAALNSYYRKSTTLEYGVKMLVNTDVTTFLSTLYLYGDRATPTLIDNTEQQVQSGYLVSTGNGLNDWYAIVNYVNARTCRYTSSSKTCVDAIPCRGTICFGRTFPSLSFSETGTDISGSFFESQGTYTGSEGWYFEPSLTGTTTADTVSDIETLMSAITSISPTPTIYSVADGWSLALPDWFNDAFNPGGSVDENQYYYKNVSLGVGTGYTSVTGNIYSYGNNYITYNPPGLSNLFAVANMSHFTIDYTATYPGFDTYVINGVTTNSTSSFSVAFQGTDISWYKATGFIGADNPQFESEAGTTDVTMQEWNGTSFVTVNYSGAGAGLDPTPNYYGDNNGIPNSAPQQQQVYVDWADTGVDYSVGQSVTYQPGGTVLLSSYAGFNPVGKRFMFINNDSYYYLAQITSATLTQLVFNILDKEQIPVTSVANRIVQSLQNVIHQGQYSDIVPAGGNKGASDASGVQASVLMLFEDVADGLTKKAAVAYYSGYVPQEIKIIQVVNPPSGAIDLTSPGVLLISSSTDTSQNNPFPT